jgi:putative methionine-R-sulfoxide reductase with GAF domain
MRNHMINNDALFSATSLAAALIALQLKESIPVGSAVPRYPSASEISLPWLPSVLVIAVLILVGVLIHQYRRYVSVRRQLHALNARGMEDSFRCGVMSALLRAMSFIMESRQGIESLFGRITEACLEHFHCHRVSLMVHDAASGELVLCSVSGKANEDMVGTRQKIGEGVAGWAAEHRQTVLLNNIHDANRYPGIKMGNPVTASAMIVPVVGEGELLGILNVSSHLASRRFHDEDLKECEAIAGFVGSCVLRPYLTRLIEKERNGELMRNVPGKRGRPARDRRDSLLRSGEPV